MIRVRMSELDLIDLGDDIWEEIYPRAERALEKGVDVILDRARANLRRRIGSTPRSASPAGEPPEYDSGELERSLKPGPVRRSKYRIQKSYGSDHRAAGLHEFGGRVVHGEKVQVYPARPYMRPAEEATREELDRIIEDL